MQLQRRSVSYRAFDKIEVKNMVQVKLNIMKASFIYE